MTTIQAGQCPKGGQHVSTKASVGSIKGLATYICDNCHQVFGAKAA